MKKKMFVLNTALACVLGSALLIAVLVRTFCPGVIIPGLNIPGIMLLSLAALIADHYLAPGAKRNYLWVALLSALTFGLLPWAACFLSGAQALRLGVIGGVVFTTATWLYGSILDRLSTGNASRIAPILCALGMYLASQGFAGILL